LLLGDVGEVVRQVLLVPLVVLDLLESNAFDWVGLEHAVNQVLQFDGETGDEVLALLYFRE
jgi:hypothetical protein